MEFRVNILVVIFTVLLLTSQFSGNRSQLATKALCSEITEVNYTLPLPNCAEQYDILGIKNCCRWNDGNLESTCCELSALGLGCDEGFKTETCVTCKNIPNNRGCSSDMFKPRPEGTSGVAKCCTPDGYAQCCVVVEPDDFVACDYNLDYATENC